MKERQYIANVAHAHVRIFFKYKKCIMQHLKVDNNCQTKSCVWYRFYEYSTAMMLIVYIQQCYEF